MNAPDPVRLDVGHVLPDLWPAGLGASGITLSSSCTYAAARPGAALLDGVAEATRNMAIGADGRSTLVTPGARASLHAAFAAVAGATREAVIAVAAPRWPIYERLAGVAGATLRTVDRDTAPSGLSCKILFGIEPTPSAVLIARPNNPDGRHLETERLADIAAWCREHGALLIIDGVYQAFSDASDDLEPALSCAGRWVVIDGLSKRLALAGLRVGWATTADGELFDTMSSISEATCAGVSAAAQDVACMALARVDSSEVSAMVASRRGMFLAGLDSTGIEFVTPDAGPFVLAKVPESLRSGRGLPAADLLRGTGVASGDATAHGAPGWVRMNCTVPPSELELALERLGSYA